MVRSVTPGAVRAVTFDYRQTLVSERPGEMRTSGRVAAILDDARQSRGRAARRPRSPRNWSRSEGHWLENRGRAR